MVSFSALQLRLSWLFSFCFWISCYAFICKRAAPFCFILSTQLLWYYFHSCLCPYSEEEDIIPGRPIPPECHAERHTDYDGLAVRWGLTHHKETAADCCQACLDQAKRAKPGETKCNIWVYCPSPSGCYSPDIFEHKHQECWLKQVWLYFMCSVTHVNYLPYFCRLILSFFLSTQLYSDCRGISYLYMTTKYIPIW